MTEKLRQEVSNGKHGLPMALAMCDNVTHEGDLDQGAAPAYGAWVRAARKHGSILVRDRRTPVAILTPVSKEPPINLFARWKPLKRFAKAIDRPVAGTPVEAIISLDRDR